MIHSLALIVVALCVQSLEAGPVEPSPLEGDQPGFPPLDDFTKYESNTWPKPAGGWGFSTFNGLESAIWKREYIRKNATGALIGRALDHREHDPNTCSEYCSDRGGNGVCDHACDTPGCLRDLGDCHGKESCSLDYCRDSATTCKWRCAMHGCPSLCELGSDYRQFVLIFYPQQHPQRVAERFDIIERKMLSGAHGRVRVNPFLQANEVGPAIWAPKIPTLKMTQTSWKDFTSEYKDDPAETYQTLVLYEVVSDVSDRVVVNDASVIDAFMKSAGVKFHGRATPLIMHVDQARRYDTHLADGRRRDTQEVLSNLKKGTKYIFNREYPQDEIF